AQDARTPGGLPVRVRQAHIAPQLKDSAGPAGEPEPTAEEPRSPEQVRRTMASYQSGTRAGRAEAERLLDEPDPNGSAAT
ncbi:hypothetical protein, partial [Micromonospora sp. KC213]